MNANDMNFWPDGWAEALATLIAAIVGAVVVWLVSRARARHIICTELPHTVTSFDGWKLRMTPKVEYDGVPIDTQLSALRLRFRNTGRDPIPRPENITIIAKGPAKLLDVVPDDPARMTNRLTLPSTDCKANLEFDYLNPWVHYRDSIEVTLVFDGRVRRLKVEGQGQGWSLRYASIDSQRSRMLVTDSCLFLVLALPPFLLSPAGLQLGYILLWFAFVATVTLILGYRRNDLQKVLGSVWDATSARIDELRHKDEN